jgi:hypothetical protein
MPSHSLHILQPLDVSCFAPLKVGYDYQAENLIRSQLNHITKLEFLPCFKAAFNASITTNNILEGFKGAGLALFDPEVIISKLDVRLRMSSSPSVSNALWQSQIPSNTLEFGS